MRTPESARDPAAPLFMLAPMEGISDAIVRDLLAGLGGMDLAVTEFIRVAHRVLPPSVFLRECPELTHGGRTSSGVPVLVQLLGGQAELVAASARVAADLGAPGIDLNFGCPAKKVNGSDGGAALLREPCRLTEVIGAVRAAVPRELPVSAKIRLGWEDPSDVVTLARAAEAGGAAWLTIHGRTRAQQYRPHADWHRIREAMEAISIPVVANGDLFTPEALARCQAVTGATAFMFGRGAFRTPNLFRWARGLDEGPWPLERTVALLDRFVARVLADPRYDHPPRAALNRLKGWTSAIAEVSPEMAAAFALLKRATQLEAALEVLRSIEPERRVA